MFLKIFKVFNEIPKYNFLCFLIYFKLILLFSAIHMTSKIAKKKGNDISRAIVDSFFHINIG